MALGKCTVSEGVRRPALRLWTGVRATLYLYTDRNLERHTAAPRPAFIDSAVTLLELALMECDRMNRLGDVTRGTTVAKAPSPTSSCRSISSVLTRWYDTLGHAVSRGCDVDMFNIVLDL